MLTKNLDLQEAMEKYSLAVSLGCKMSSGCWSPEEQDRGDILGREGPEFISVHNTTKWTPEMIAALEAAGFKGSPKAGYDYLVQKSREWPSERYARMSEKEQVEADEAWVNMGGHLSDEKMERLWAYRERRNS